MRRPTRGTVSGLIGFKSYFRLSGDQDAQLQGHIEVLMFAGGYAGLQHVEGGMANLCLLVTAGKAVQAGTEVKEPAVILREGPNGPVVTGAPALTAKGSASLAQPTSPTADRALPSSRRITSANAR